MFAASSDTDEADPIMRRKDRRHTGEPFVAVALAFTSCFLLACPSRTSPVTAAAPPPPARVEKAPEPQPAGPDPALRELEQKSHALELKLLEQDSEVQDLKVRLSDQQREVDGAIQDVVRAKAKLMSLESRAEAASQIAETEIALKSLKDTRPGTADPEITQIRHLVDMSGQEFEKENFGGALYLAIQAKGRIQTVQTRAHEPAPAGVEAASFTKPLPLKVLKPSNVREHPDVASPVLVKLRVGV